MTDPIAPFPVPRLPALDTVPSATTQPPVLSEPRFVELLGRIAGEAQGERITIGALAEAFGRRGHGALLVLLGLPNMLPLPVPALSLLTGLPLLILAVQIALGHTVPWFPARLRDRSLSTNDLRRIAEAVVVRLVRLERIVHPRWSFATGALARRILGCFAVVLAFALFLPLPFGNALPGLALALIGLALLERDGAAALAAVVVGLAGLAVTAAASMALLGGVLMFLRETVG